MTLDNAVPVVIVAIVVISSVVSALKKAKAGFDGVVAKQRATEPERLAAIKAELARRGIQAPAGLQGVISMMEADAAKLPVSPSAQPMAYVAQPAYVPPAQYAAPAPQAALGRRAAPIARSVDAPVFRGVPAAPQAATMRGTLAEAFGDPAHARNAVILLEVLGPPVALR